MTLGTAAAGVDANSGRERLLAAVRVGPEVHGDRGEECVPHELWLVTKSAGAFQAEQLLFADCTRETPWPVETTVKGDDVVIDTGGYSVPSNWHGSVSVSFHLSWPSFTGFHAEFAFRLAACPSHVVSSVDDGFSASVTWRKTARAAADDSGNDVCSADRAYVALPLVPLPPNFESGLFRTVPFDECSAALDGTGGARGVAISGTTAGAVDATLRAVVSERGVLYVDIADDHFTGATDDASASDHVEIWTSPHHDSYMSGAEELLPKSARFGVRVADGRVFDVESAEAPPSVARAERDGHVVLRIPLPASTEKLRERGLSVAYVDVDPGEAPAIVSTSRTDARTASSLGAAEPVHHGVTCRLDGGKLVRALPAKGRDEALKDYLHDP